MKWFLTRRWLSYVAAPLLLQWNVAPMRAESHESDQSTTTPVQHVIVIIGENRSFDHVFATYRPHGGQDVSNLLSKDIINADGKPAHSFGLSAQNQATDSSTFQLSPGSKSPFQTLPAPNTDGAPQSASDTSPAPFATLAAATAAEPGLLSSDLHLLLTGATGLPGGSIDTRIDDYNNLPNGPFQRTPSVPYDAYAASPVHRFYQMWQQSDCNVAYASRSNPSGCLNDLYPWVEVTIGAGSNGNAQPRPFSVETTREGATAMGFYNVQHGDAPYLAELADTYTLSDNFHQSVMGGTGANHVMLGSGDAIWYSDGKGHTAAPPSNQIENPNPATGTNNWYTQDGYSGGTYSNCSDAAQPGVGAVVGFLNSLPYHPSPRCAPATYYLLNNYSPGYFGDGSVNTGTFVIPPSTLPTIGDRLVAHNISWKYYGEGWNLYLQDPHYKNPDNQYCDICNPFQYSTSIMTSATLRTAHLKDVTGPDGLYADLQNGALPAVSFVKPDGFVDGHPASSKLDLFEGFVRKVLTNLQANPQLAASTAVFVTFDESGGYYDSGYIQPLDFFGDGPRIPLIVVSPFSRGGRVVHSYNDHVSILKFIEKNWKLPPVSNRSRDNFPNPIASRDNPYAPTNGPAIGDLMDMFDFGEHP
jgi:phospholipase C